MNAKAGEVGGRDGELDACLRRHDKSVNTQDGQARGQDAGLVDACLPRHDTATNAEDGEARRPDAFGRARFGRIGIVARWRPVHRGHAPVLTALCEHAATALIGIGSSNRYDFRNPFTCDEAADMIRLALAGRDNFVLIPVPDLDDGPRWRKLVLELFGPLDAFCSDNPYVASLLAADYRIVRPVELVALPDRIPIDGALVRQEMARGDGWVDLVPSEIAAYIRSRRLDARFRREFGLQTLALATIMQ